MLNGPSLSVPDVSRSPIPSAFVAERSWIAVKKKCERSGGSSVSTVTPTIPAPRYCDEETFTLQRVTSVGKVTR